MARYKKYNGPDKYHFRIYKKNGNHPFIVVAVSEIYINGHYYLSGYMITHNVQKYLDYPEKYVQLNSNPNPNDDSPSFLCKTRISNMKDSCFSKPYSNWHLNCKDIAEIEKLEETKKRVSHSLFHKSTLILMSSCMFAKTICHVYNHY